MLGILLALGVSFAIAAEEPKKDPMICVTNEELDKMLPGKGYDILLNIDRKSTRLNSSHSQQSRMPSSA